MPSLLLSFKKISDSEILIHGALTPNEKRSASLMEQHAEDCPKFGPAWKANETIQATVEVEDVPEFTEEDILDWVNALLGMEEEGDDDEEDEEDEDEEDDVTEE